MPIIHLHINGLTHHDIAGQREEWLRTAMGRRMVLSAAPCREDAMAVATYVGAEMVGYVACTDQDMAWAAMCGMGVKVLRGEVSGASDCQVIHKITVSYVIFCITITLTVKCELDVWRNT